MMSLFNNERILELHWKDKEKKLARKVARKVKKEVTKEVARETAAKTARETATYLVRLGKMTFEEIAEATKLPLNVVKELEQQLKPLPE